MLPMGTRLVWDTDSGGRVIAVEVVVVVVAAGFVVMIVTADIDGG